VSTDYQVVQPTLKLMVWT